MKLLEKINEAKLKIGSTLKPILSFRYLVGDKMNGLQG